MCYMEEVPGDIEDEAFAINISKPPASFPISTFSSHISAQHSETTRDESVWVSVCKQALASVLLLPARVWPR